jgi:hypothetical protein
VPVSLLSIDRSFQISIFSEIVERFNKYTFGDVTHPLIAPGARAVNYVI